MDGREVLGELLSARPDQAVIVLSCVADVAAKVDLLERGAQDYLTKPFSLAELLARVRVRLRGEPHHAEQHHTPRRSAGPRPLMPPLTAPRSTGHARGEVIRAGHVTLDVGKLVADIGQGPVPLTRLEFLLLRELAEHTGQSVSKGSLLASVWGYDFDPGSNVVDVCVRRIRSKLGFELIKTVRGEGYQLVAREPGTLSERCRRRGAGHAWLAARLRWPCRPLVIDVVWAGFALANLDAIFLFAGWETIPFHFIWVSLTLVYGFRTWRHRPTLWVLAAVMVLTAAGIGHGRLGRPGADRRAHRGPAARA